MMNTATTVFLLLGIQKIHSTKFLSPWRRQPDSQPILTNGLDNDYFRDVRGDPSTDSDEGGGGGGGSTQQSGSKIQGGHYSSMIVKGGEERSYQAYSSSSSYELDQVQQQKVEFARGNVESRKQGEEQISEIAQLEEINPHLRKRRIGLGEQQEQRTGGGRSQFEKRITTSTKEKAMAQPGASYDLPASQGNHHPGVVAFSNKRLRRSLQQQSPMPLQEISTTNNNNQNVETQVGGGGGGGGGGCLPSGNGNYGSQEGAQVDLYFFYQVVANQGTTESQINGVLLDDIEITLLDFMIPLLFPSCSGTSVITRMGTGGGRYVGISSKPADFVLRGFECTDKAQPPCFVVSGSMTAYTIGLSAARAQIEIRRSIYKVMDSGAIAATISRVNAVALLDDSLNLATMPTITTNSPTSTTPPQQSTRLPTPTPTTNVPTHAPTPAPTTRAPTISPTTKQPTPMPNRSPSTFAPTTPKTTIVIIQTSQPSSTNEPTIGSPALTEVPSPTTLPTAHTTLSSSPVPPPTGQSNSSNADLQPTLQPTLPPTQEPSMAFVMKPAEHKSAIEKVPPWVWFILAFAICICCSYADLDDDGDDAGVNHTIRMQERTSLAKERERDINRRDSLNDSEVFSSVEYVRKLYRQ